MEHGKLFVVLLFILALILAGFGLYYRYAETHEVVAFWGAEPSQRIASPDQIELWALRPFGEQTRSLSESTKISIQGQEYAPETIRDVTAAPGFLNASSALTLSRNYHWNPGDCKPTWTHALLYRRGKETTVVAISLDCGWVYSAETDQVAGIKTITEGLARLFREQLGS